MPFRSCRAAVACVLLLSSPAAAQRAERGTTVVEILGLQTWTRQMVEDSVAKYQPGISLADHACAVILRDSVGFANAASIGFSMGGDTTWSILPVVEPARRAQVRFRAYGAARPKVQEWADVFAILERDRQAMGSLQHFEVLLGDADSVFGRPVPAGAMELRRALRRHGTPRDWELARTAILLDSSWANRTVAALVLSNFAERDSTYHLLAEGLRATDVGASAAGMILSALAQGAPRRVDWSPATDALRALFGGTNLFAYRNVMNALVATEIDPALDRELAGVDPELLLAHLGARNPLSPPPVHRYLVHLRGEDPGRDPAAWRAWLTASARPAPPQAPTTPPDEGTYELSAVEVKPEIANRAEIGRLVTRGYPPSLRGSGVTGQVTVRFRVLENGRVEAATVQVVESSHEAFNEPAIAVARRMVLRPALIRDRPVIVWVELPLTFRDPGAAAASPPPER